MSFDAQAAAALRRTRTFLVLWTLVCVVLGAVACWQVLELRTGVAAMDDAGRSLQRTGSTLDVLGELPLVGGGVERAAEAVEGGGDTVRESAASIDRTIVVLAILVGVALATLPTVPLIIVWWLLGSATRRDAAAP